MELHGMDNLLDRIALTEEIQRGGMFQHRDASGKEPFGVVVVMGAILCGGKVGEAVQAYLSLADYQDPATAGTRGGEKGLYDALQDHRFRGGTGSCRHS
jgi:hypothetical protein